jgi:hypothetical protein
MGTAAGGDPVSTGPGEWGNEGDSNYEGYVKRSITLVLTDLHIWVGWTQCLMKPAAGRKL